MKNEDAGPERMMAALVMCSPEETLNEAEGVITPGMFQDHLCRLIWEVCEQLFADGQPITPRSLRKNQKLASHVDEVRDIRASFVTTAHLSHHIEEFADLVAKRKLMDIARMIDDQIITGTASKIIDDVLATITDLSATDSAEDRKTRTARDVMMSTVNSIEEAQRNRGKMLGLNTGIGKLNVATGGLQAGKLYVVAGRPAKGKSVLGMQIATYAARYDAVSTVVFSLEMSNEELGQRLVASETGLPINEIMEGVDDGSGGRQRMSESANSKILQAATTLAQTKLYFRDYPVMTALSLRIEVRKQVQAIGAKLFLIDYLQLFTMRGNSQDRRLAIGEITKTCKQLAKQYNISFILISQLNRDGDGKTQMSLSHLSDSDEIGRDADVVMCLNEDQDLDVIKNRSGPTGLIYLNFDGPTFKFTEGQAP